MSRELDSKLLTEFLKLAAKKLKGNWLLVGGTLLPAVGINIRSTIDIDLVGLSATEQAQNLELMELVESLGLSVESVNQTAAFFVQKAKPTNADLIVLLEGKSAVIYRPTVYLYWKLKVARLSESDVLDCQHYYQYSIGQKDPINKEKLEKMLRKARAEEKNHDRRTRIDLLLGLLVTLHTY